MTQDSAPTTELAPDAPRRSGNGEAEPHRLSEGPLQRRSPEGALSDGDQVFLPTGEYADYLAVKAAEIANNRAEAREKRWRAILAGVLAVVALIGYSDLRTVTRNTVQTVVDDYFEMNRNILVGEAFGDVLQEIDSKIAFVQLSTLAADIWKRKTGFTNAERDAANALLKEALLSETVTSKPQFTTTVYNLVASYAAADLEGYVDELESIVGSVGISDRNVAGVFLTHYGLRVAGSVRMEEADKERMNRYADAVEQHKFPELSTQWRMALAHRQAGGKRSPIVESLLENVSFFTPEEQSKFFKLLEATSTLRGPQSQLTGKLVRAAELFQGIQERYRPEFAQLRERVDAAPGVGTDLSERLEELIERLGVDE